jgi:phosphate transport system substrate-binding protein
LRSRRLGAAALAAALTAVAIPTAADAKPVITMSGSTSVAPLAAKLAKKYLSVCHRCVSFKLLQGGSDVGIADVSHGRVTIGNSSRDPKPGDPPGLVFNRIARDGICLITNNSNPVANLSQQQVQAIFSGQARSWSGVPGASGGTIDLIVRTAASGTQDAFQKIFMGTAKVSATAAQKASNGLIQQAVKSDPNGIGYVSFAFTQGVHAAAYQGVACNLRNAKSGQYGGLRNFWMVTRGAPTGATKKWINWAANSRAARAITATEWVPLG